MAFGMSPFPLRFGSRQGGGGGFTPHLWVDSENGDDGNDGATLATALQTLAELASDISSSQRAGLVTDSIWLERFILTGLTGIDARGVGDGATPLIANLVAAAGATREDSETYPNVWLFVVAHSQASALTHPGVYVTDTDDDWSLDERYRRVGTSAQNTENSLIIGADKAACLANVNANSGRFYYEYASSEHRYYVYSTTDPSSNGLYYWVKGEESALTGNESGTFQNIHLFGAAARNGVCRDNEKVARKFKNIIFRDGGIHTMLAGGGKLFEDCQSIGNPDCGATTFHLNSPTASDGAAYVRCEAFGPFATIRTDILGGIAYYDHTAPIDNVTIIDSYSDGQASFATYDGDVGAVYAIGARVNTRLGDLSGSWPTLAGGPQATPYGAYGTLTGNWYSENGVYFLGGTHGMQLSPGTVRFYNERFVFRPGRNDAAAPGVLGMFLRAQTKTGVDVEFNYCTIVIDTYGADLQNAVNNYLYSETGACTGTIKFNDCILVIKRPNAINLNVTHGSFNVVVSMTNTFISPNFATLPMSGYTQTSDIFATDASWRTNDWTLSGTSPAIAADAGWRADRTPIYRPTAVAIAQALGASVS